MRRPGQEEKTGGERWQGSPPGRLAAGSAHAVVHMILVCAHLVQDVHHLTAGVWQPQHVALAKVAVGAHDDDVGDEGQGAQEALQRLRIRGLVRRG